MVLNEIVQQIADRVLDFMRIGRVCGRIELEPAIGGVPRIVSCSNDRTIRVWDAGTGEVLMKLNGLTGHWIQLCRFFTRQARITG